MKKIVCILAALGALVSTSIGAAAAAPAVEALSVSSGMIEPRFSVIRNCSGTAKVSGSEIVISGRLEARNSASLSIDVTVKRDGRTVDSFSADKKGTILNLSQRSDYVKGHKYTVIFAFDAGGETHTIEKTVR